MNVTHRFPLVGTRCPDSRLALFGGASLPTSRLARTLAPPTIRCVVVATLILLTALVSISAKATHPPDIVIFLTDDQSQLDCTPYGSNLRTPNMQRVADNGLTFTHAFVASPSCAPRHAA